MTDPQTPGDKPDIDDVVERANAGLADAEAAGRAATEAQPETPAQDTGADAVTPEPAQPDAAPEPAAAPEQPPAAPEAAAAIEPEAAGAEPAAGSEQPPAPETERAGQLWPRATEIPADVTPAAETTDAAAADAEAPAADAPAAEAPSAEATETAAPADGTETAVVAGAAGGAAAASTAAPEEPAGLTAIAGPRPVYVAAPEPPTPRGNRGAAGLIGLLAAVLFAVLYLGAWTLVDMASGSFDAANLGNRLIEQVSQPDLWVPTVVFFLGFWLLGAFINRGRWGYWVVFGILVGAVAYVGHIAGQLAHAQAWNLSYAASEKLVRGELFAPLAIAAFIIGRELTIWFGAWVAARGRRITALNVAAQEEYERSLEAGPQSAATRG